jgi:hypothetical protein
MVERHGAGELPWVGTCIISSVIAAGSSYGFLEGLYLAAKNDGASMIRTFEAIRPFLRIPSICAQPMCTIPAAV